VAAEDSSTRFTTVACVVVDLFEGRASYATAGHPPPLLRLPDGVVVQLEDANAVPLGLQPGVVRPEATVELPVGAALVLYSDGLVERRGESIDAGLARLRDALAGQHDVSSRQMVDRVVARLLRGRARHDDVVLLCAHRLPRGSLRHRFAARPGELAAARHGLAGWLTELPRAVADADALVLAAGEALSNAVEHGHRGDGRTVELTAWAEESGVAVRVGDRGTWQTGSASPFGGRGLRIMDALTEKVAIERGDPPEVSGTTVTLRHRYRA
jgi:anti-sigma regulatory factor (Ser/Thr protein kinase)